MCNKLFHFIVFCSLTGLSIQDIQAKKKPIKTPEPKTIEWAESNATVNKFRNGDTLIFAASEAAWVQACSNKQAAYCIYENNDSIGRTIGYLYNWYAITDTRSLAPKGWKIPNEQDWKTFKNQIYNSDSTIVIDSPIGEIDEIYAKNGLTIQYGGDRSHTGEFKNLGSHMAWWSIDAPTYNSWTNHGFGGYSGVDTDENQGKCVGLYVRFIKDK
jgi:uncharacterized protein (TIGR02145 family)